MAFHGRIFGWLPWQWTWAISCDGMRTHNYTRGRASYVPTRCVLCFEMQRAMHRSHGNKRGTIGSRSTSAVILTKYSAVLKCSETRLWDFGVILLRYSTVKGVPHANMLQQQDEACTVRLDPSIELRDPSSFSHPPLTSPKVKRTDSAIKYAPLISLAKEFFFIP